VDSRGLDVCLTLRRYDSRMPLTQLQHYMVLSKDLERTRAFYCDVLGLRLGPRPPFKFDGWWIYVGDVAAIHVAGRESYDQTSRSALNPSDPVKHGSGSVDHIAFAATGYDELIASFERHGVQYRGTQVPGSDLRQLFVFDPDGVQIEINIRSKSA
jgi:catechol 2,3-dioxygenase-like lactoylglutathione lyase family enzyme